MSGEKPESSRRRAGGRPVALIWVLIALTALLALPVDFTLTTLGAEPAARLQAVAASAAVVMLLVGLHGLGTPRLGWLWLLPALFLLLLIRLVQYGTVDFSGAGFTDAFFLHLGGESARVALQEYARLARRGAVLLVLLMAVVFLWMRAPLVDRRAKALGLVAAGLVLALGLRGSLPEWQFFEAWQEWNEPPRLEVDQALLDRWSESGLLDASLREKWQVEATAPDQPLNLIVLYLESVGVNLTEQVEWPGLMPNLDRMLREHAWVNHLWASSYITIEGITNTQCGTLLPFDRGSASMAGGDGLADSLPCLGDVLDRAGYHQVYLGGAETSFAGKGAFLAAHGFDEIRGIDEWRDQGLDQRPGTWGLSDPDLFEQSLSTIDRLRDLDQPWNLTLLTIGTHLPGYRYAECRPYAGGTDVFLHALHCTDQLLGRWTQALRERGLLEDTVVVITADHQVFPSSDMKALFGDGVYDRRLPMVVLGPARARPAQAVGAGYDFAPTVLDLLGVRHDAEFALGRSLARAASRPPYLVSRYDDVQNDRRFTNAAECAGDQRRVPPLDRCEKQELLAVLGAVARGYSEMPSALGCTEEGIDLIRVATDGRGLETVLIGGEEQADRFIHNGRAVDRSRSGWSLLVLDSAGRVSARPFIPEDIEPNTLLDSLSGRFEGMDSAIVIWSGVGEPTRLPWLDFDPQESARVWWIGKNGRILANSNALPATDDRVVHQLRIDRRMCQRSMSMAATPSEPLRYTPD